MITHRIRRLVVTTGLIAGLLPALSSPVSAATRAEPVLQIDPKSGVVRVFQAVLSCDEDPEHLLYVSGSLSQGDRVDDFAGRFSCSTSGPGDLVVVLTTAGGFRPGRAFLSVGGFECVDGYCDTHYYENEVRILPFEAK